MKRIIILSIFLLCSFVANELNAQIRINGYAGYVFKDKVDSYYSNNAYFEGKIQDGLRWGVGVEYNVPDLMAIELQYKRQETNSPTYYKDNKFGSEIQFTDFDVNINWIMVNATRYFPVSELVEPFFGVGVGAGIFDITNPDNGRSDSATKFSWQFRGGTNLWLSSNIGLRLQASLFSATQAFGGGLYFGTGGIGGGVNNYSSMYQFGFDGGLVLKLGN
ncbi:outer membrane beta-barrel protein [Marinigracilibium pacificum]|uniref:Porin family protein n=1 Tax=Marinigracilibium pacificum TaxID=2729599 RepID=A0A848IWU4_9BACT|nr:outer membrane beta-barrel protein [Marinigracilibium pacificum]NMM48136.1 porin family protein [Marinigracilibium pacificum]